jgi:hypothetical protein
MLGTENWGLILNLGWQLAQLSDLLDYENAQIAHSNEKALNGLVKETKDENSKMRILTVSSKSSQSDTGLTASTGEVHGGCSCGKT